ncbi:nucleotide sugar dehydrogenase [Paenibacillus sp. 598K]|nr:nucleotide sugar dehydrogenase [Paenibacillus sp. 598K]
MSEVMNEAYERLKDGQDKLAVIGLGYVGLPLAVAFGRKVNVIGFDVDARKIETCRQGRSPIDDVSDDELSSANIAFTSDEGALAEASFLIVAVPTPLQSDKVPDLSYIRKASALVGRQLRRGATVVFESTVYPGVTEEIAGPILEAESGLRCGIDFRLGYSPERINPGDQVHRLDNIVKIVSGMDKPTLELVAAVYELIVEAGVYRAESIKVAEAAKVIENAQRDINIAFMNELSMLFHQLDIDTQAVLRAAGTKWNFMHFEPGLVGGHCIGIDPYYLTYKAEGHGYRSRIILAGRHINDGMGPYIAQQLIKQLVKGKQDLSSIRIGILGITYKENCSDIRNSRVPDIISELAEYGVTTLVSDPMADPQEVWEEYSVRLCPIEEMRDLSAIVVAVPHEAYAALGPQEFDRLYEGSPLKLMVDVKSLYDRSAYEAQGYVYWSL